MLSLLLCLLNNPKILKFLSRLIPQYDLLGHILGKERLSSISKVFYVEDEETRRMVMINEPSTEELACSLERLPNLGSQILGTRNST